MTDANIPDIKVEPDKVVEKVRERFALGLSEEEAMNEFRALIDDSLSRIVPQIIDNIHEWMQKYRGWRRCLSKLRSLCCGTHRQSLRSFSLHIRANGGVYAGTEALTKWKDRFSAARYQKAASLAVQVNVTCPKKIIYAATLSDLRASKACDTNNSCADGCFSGWGRSARLLWSSLMRVRGFWYGDGIACFPVKLVHDHLCMPIFQKLSSIPTSGWVDTPNLLYYALLRKRGEIADTPSPRQHCLPNTIPF